MQIYKFVFLVFLTFFYDGMLAQTAHQIDELIMAAEKQSSNGDIKNAMTKTFEAIRLSENINYDKGKAKAFYNIASMLSITGEYDKSIEYVKKTEKYEKVLNNDIELKIDLLILDVFNFNNLRFPEAATSKYKEALNLALTIKDSKKKKKYLLKLYTISHIAYAEKKQYYNSFLKAKNIIRHPNDVFDSGESKENILMTQADVYGKLATYHIYNKNLDSAAYYYDRMQVLTKEMQNKFFVEGMVLEGYSKIAEQKGEFDKALTYLTETEKIFKKYNVYPNLIPIYEQMMMLYDKTGNVGKEKEYSGLYRKLSDSLMSAENKGRDKTLSNILERKEQELQEFHNQRLIKEIIFFLIIISLLMLAFYLILRKYSSKNKHKIAKAKQLIDEKEEIIFLKEEETQELKLKVNESFEEVIQLAKTNSPELLTRFREVYPDYYKKLESIEPGLLTTEIKLCVMVFLGFTTKDIADYTFVTVKAVQHRKFRLRKKLGIPSDMEIISWIEKI